MTRTIGCSAFGIREREFDRRPGAPEARGFSGQAKLLESRDRQLLIHLARPPERSHRLRSRRIPMLRADSESRIKRGRMLWRNCSVQRWRPSKALDSMPSSEEKKSASPYPRSAANPVPCSTKVNISSAVPAASPVARSYWLMARLASAIRTFAPLRRGSGHRQSATNRNSRLNSTSCRKRSGPPLRRAVRALKATAVRWPSCRLASTVLRSAIVRSSLTQFG